MSGSTSFTPMRQRQRKDSPAIHDAVNEVDPFDWLSTEGNAVNEFKTDVLANMAFPTLFTHGKGCPTFFLPFVQLTVIGQTCKDC